jgi:hypothetical protein
MVSHCVATRVLHVDLFAVGFTTCIMSVLIRKNYIDVKTTRNRVLTTNFDIRALIYRGYFGIFSEYSVFLNSGFYWETEIYSTITTSSADIRFYSQNIARKSKTIYFLIYFYPEDEGSKIILK